MTKNYNHMVFVLWYSLLWASPTLASFENSKHPNNTLFSISKDSLTNKKSDTTNNQKPATRSLSDAEVNPLMARWKKEKGPLAV